MSRDFALGSKEPEPDFASPSFYADALRPVGMASVLPPAAFRSLAFSQMEDIAVWTRDWICVGAHHDIPEIGDLLPFTVGVHGLHVQRQSAGLVARFNKAQHGGCRFVPVQCQGGSKTRCSFTSCGYSRDGGPIPAGALGDGTPDMHQYLGLRPERLLTAQVRSWGPLIFVNLDLADPDFGDAVSSLGRAVTFFDNSRRARLSNRWVEHAANWKLLAQNLVGDAGDGSVSGTHWHAGHSVLGDGQRVSAAWLFPNLVLLSDAEETCALVLQSTAIGQTLCRISVFGQCGRNGDAAERWIDRIAPLVQRAVEDQTAMAKWGTTSRPDTIGAALPLQEQSQGLWMQRMLSQRMLSVSALDVDTQRYQSSRLR